MCSHHLYRHSEPNVFDGIYHHTQQPSKHLTAPRYFTSIRLSVWATLQATTTNALPDEPVCLSHFSTTTLSKHSHNIMLKDWLSLRADNEPPLYVGVSGDSCLTCNKGFILPSESPLYMPGCHANEEHFICQDCYAQKWLATDDDTLMCPWYGCNRVAMKYQQHPGIYHVKIDPELIDRTREYRLRADFNKYPITVRCPDARTILQELHNLYADQLLDPAALGGPPNSANDDDSDVATWYLNPFYMPIMEYFWQEDRGTYKFYKTATEMEDDLMALVNQAMTTHVTNRFDHLFDAPGAKVDGVADEPILDNWRSIVYALISILCYRHLDRFGQIDPEEEQKLIEASQR
jgi:hypothetical protein